MGHLVVGLDGTYVDDPALQAALVEAALSRARLEVVHAFAAGPADDPKGAECRRRRAHRLVEAALHNTIQRHPQLSGVPVEFRVASGSPAEVLERFSRDAQLLVVTASGAAGVGEAGLGSTARDCAHNSTCPLMVVPAQLAELCPVRRVVLAVDPSGPRGAAGAWAHEEALRHQCELVIVSAWTGGTTGPDEALAQRALEGELSACGDLPSVQGELLHGHTAKSLRQVLRPDDILVLGSRHRAGRYPTGLPSVGGALLHAAPCPLVLISDPLTPSHHVTDPQDRRLEGSTS
ncbi:MAG: universal stress protein UspA [Frankiales bacterium]|nr:universal stress protein UspA [Frankiales bacterium]